MRGMLIRVRRGREVKEVVKEKAEKIERILMKRLIIEGEE